MAKNVRLKFIFAAVAVILCFSFGIIPTYAKARELSIGGEPFGLKLYCNGVMITRLDDFESKGKNVCPARESGLRINDVIKSIDGQKTTSNEQTEEIIEASKGKPMKLSVTRENKEIIVSLKAQKDNSNEYRAGMWVRDSCAGIGTISFYDEENGVYGALGHGICDIDTGALIKNSTGEILTADINSVTKSENNRIGSLNGIFTNQTIGTIFENTPTGVYGNLNKRTNKKKYPAADESEVKIGKASLFTTTDGSSPKEYEIEITSICNTQKYSNRNFTVKITDKRLLNKTGGIVQGMSGSPIVQNNKIIGALTHVFLENCREGYGVFIGNML
ncbi:MAG: SpoIVB peptidase [Ruminococcus sp.]|nr:SpoIVB peptidase [Ruminococcus sp.]